MVRVFSILLTVSIKEGRKKMFYLTTHSTHFIYDYMASLRKEGNVLFNDALNIFYVWLYGVGHMVKEGKKCFI